MSIDGLIFDLDGTLWDAIDRSIEAWREVLSQFPDAHRTDITAAELRASVGLTMDALGRKIVPALSDSRREDFLEQVSVRESALLAEHGGKLYPRVEETLAALESRCPLFLVSNCEERYLEAFFQAHGLRHYFTDCECAERTGLPKSENIRLICARNHLSSPVYVGDTAFDAEACRAAGVSFVFASYGYGHVSGTQYTLASFSDLLTLPL